MYDLYHKDERQACSHLYCLQVLLDQHELYLQGKQGRGGEREEEDDDDEVEEEKEGGEGKGEGGGEEEQEEGERVGKGK